MTFNGRDLFILNGPGVIINTMTDFQNIFNGFLNSDDDNTVAVLAEIIENNLETPFKSFLSNEIESLNREIRNLVAPVTRNSKDTNAKQTLREGIDVNLLVKYMDVISKKNQNISVLAKNSRNIFDDLENDLEMFKTDYASYLRNVEIECQLSESCEYSDKKMFLLNVLKRAYEFKNRNEVHSALFQLKRFKRFFVSYGFKEEDLDEDLKNILEWSLEIESYCNERVEWKFSRLVYVLVVFSVIISNFDPILLF